MSNIAPIKVAPLGSSSCLLYPVSEPHQVAHSLAQRFPSLLVRPGLDSVAISGPDIPSSEELINAATTTVDANNSIQERHLIPVRYDGADLDNIASLLALSIEAVVATHARMVWQVALIGFAPGFPYLIPHGEGPNPFASLPRLDSPRTRVPAGSVAVAAGMGCIYPKNLPGGWQLLGTTDVVLFQPENPTSPSLLSPGDLVQFERTDL